MMLHPDLGYFDEGADLTDATLYESASRPFGEASVLPPLAFRSKIFSDLEDEKIWSRSWVAVGTQQEIPNAGDLLPFTIGNHGIHVQRNDDGSLTGRFNKAQHGGCRAVPLQCQTGSKTKCSFTSCGFSRDRDGIPAGELGDNTPAMHQYLGLVPERLLPVKVETWGPFIFANLDPASHPLMEELDDLPDRVGAYVEQARSLGAKAWLERPSNWKLAGRAFGGSGGSEPAAHAKGGGRAASMAGRAHAYTLEVVALGDARLGHACGGTLLPLPGLSSVQASRGALCWVFPNLLIAALPTHLVSVILQPLSMAESLQRFCLFTANDAGTVADGEIAQLREAWLDTLRRNAARAESLQELADGWGTPRQPETTDRDLPREDDPTSYVFQSYIIGKILEEHETYRNAPLYGRA